MDSIPMMNNLPSDLLLDSGAVPKPSPLEQTKVSGNTEALKETAKQFEGVFIQQLFNQMKQGLEQIAVEDEESSTEHIKNMYWTFMADVVTEQGGLGMWKQIYQQMSGQSAESPIPAESQLDEKV